MKLGASEHQLEVTTPTDREIVMTRVFDAPRELVFDAFTKPEIVDGGCSRRKAGRWRSATST